LLFRIIDNFGTSGPKAARVSEFHLRGRFNGWKQLKVYAETRKNILEGKDIAHEVVILRDGFTEFQAKYRVGDLFFCYKAYMN